MAETRGHSMRMPAALLAMVLLVPAWAREGDRSAPATIEAGRAEIERPDGVHRYFGDVVFVQGTLRITGDEMTVRAPNGTVQFAESIGDPATTRQQTDEGEIVDAEASRIEYHADEQLVILTGDAVVTRGGERFTAGRIRYRTDTGRVVAGPSPEQEGEGERVRIRIEPEPENGE
jgi:lipopolysaccharide export system protein LptA